MDGYAVRAVDTTAAPVTLPVVARIQAGAAPDHVLGPGQAMRIFTGAPMPEGGDAVIPQEDVEASDDRVRIARAVERGAYVRPRGEDVDAGDRVLEPGRPLGPAEIGLLATLGHSPALVYRRPRVAVLSTGNEIADLGVEPGPGQIPNTNTYSLMAQVAEAGAEPLNLGVVEDRLEAIANPGQRRGYLRVTLSREGGEYGARLTGDQGSAILRSMVLADGLAVVPGDTVIAKGEMVDVMILRAFV